jgi:hypothetical protein
LLALQNLAILSDEENGAEKEGRSNMAYDVVIKDGRIYDGSIPASSPVECWETEASERIFEFLV